MVQQWEGVASAQDEAVKRLIQKIETAKCNDCGCEWFEEVLAVRVNLLNSPIGGGLQIKEPSIAFARCLKCGALSSAPAMTVGLPKKDLDAYNAAMDAADAHNERIKKQ